MPQWLCCHSLARPSNLIAASEMPAMLAILPALLGRCASYSHIPKTGAPDPSLSVSEANISGSRELVELP